VRARVLFVAALLLGSIAAPGTVRADIVLHDGGVERDRDAADVVTERTGLAPKMVLSGDVLAGPTRLLASNATVEQCEGTAIKLKLEEKLDTVMESVLSFELEKALEDLDVLETLLPCAAHPVPRTVLTRLAFLRGAALFDQGDEAGAKVSMNDALALDPEFEGLRGFPQPHLDLLTAGRGEGTVEPGKLFSWHREGSIEGLLVDGDAVGDPGREGVSVAPRRHLLQVRESDGRLRGMWVRTTGLDAVLVHPAAGRRVWADGGRTAGGEMAMRLLLLSEFQGRDGDIHVLRFKGRRIVSAATFPSDGGVRADWAKTKPKDRPKDKPKDEPPGDDAQADDPPATDDGQADDPPTTDDGDDDGDEVYDQPVKGSSPSAGVGQTRLRFAIGGGYQHVQGFNYALVALDVGVRLVGPLTATVFARPSYGGRFVVDAGGDEPVPGVILMVPFGLGAGIQKPEGAIAPFVFAVFQGAVNQVEPLAGFLAGAAIQGGVDFAPGDGPFIVRVQGEAGFLGASDVNSGASFVGFTGRVWAGVGARF